MGTARICKTCQSTLYENACRCHYCGRKWRDKKHAGRPSIVDHLAAQHKERMILTAMKLAAEENPLGLFARACLDAEKPDPAPIAPATIPDGLLRSLAQSCGFNAWGSFMCGYCGAVVRAGMDRCDNCGLHHIVSQLGDDGVYAWWKRLSEERPAAARQLLEDYLRQPADAQIVLWKADPFDKQDLWDEPIIIAA